MVYDVAIGLLCVDFIFDAVNLLYVVKIVTDFYKLLHDRVKRDVVGCMRTCVCFKFLGVCFCQELAKLTKCHK